MSDNELDNLFKEAAEGFVPPKDESAWKEMASMLDRHAVKTAGFWSWKTIAALSLTAVISITAVWFSDTRDQDNIYKTRETNGSNSATQGVVQKQKEQTHPAGNENLPPAESMETTSHREHSISETEVENETELENKNPATTSISAQADKEISVPANRGQFHGSEESEAGVFISDQSDSHAVVQQGEGEEQPAAEEEFIQEFIPTTDSVTQEVNGVNDTTQDVAMIVAKKDEKVKRGRVLSIKAAVSPDFSSVNFFSASKSGFNYGFLAGYAFNSRWSVYTGVIASKKLYATKEVEGTYNWDGFDYPVKELDGDCRILDIPINLYYTFFPERPFSLRAGLGFSSYIMRKESYVYCVDNYGDEVYYEQQVKGKNNEWFKVLNVSVAVSKQLTNRLSAEFEPFVKAPLAGVGEGKVSLVSMGAFINLKYDLLFLK